MCGRSLRVFLLSRLYGLLYQAAPPDAAQKARGIAQAVTACSTLKALNVSVLQQRTEAEGWSETEERCFSQGRRSSAQPTSGCPKAGRPEAARGEERGSGRFYGLAASTAATVREVGINSTERQAGNAQRGRTSEREERIQRHQRSMGRPQLISQRAAQALCVSGISGTGGVLLRYRPAVVPAMYSRFPGRAARPRKRTGHAKLRSTARRSAGSEKLVRSRRSGTAQTAPTARADGSRRGTQEDRRMQGPEPWVATRQ